MGVFRFKRFEVSNSFSAMKIGTDSVLLGSCAPVAPGAKRVLDVGTGTGVVALMLAQRLSDYGEDFRIEGIDIDEASAAEAEGNFKASPWSENLSAEKCALSSWEEKEYDLIVSNPPFFDDSLLNPDERKSVARHTKSLSYRELCEYAARTLSSEGLLSMVLPKDVQKDLVRVAASFGLYLSECVDVRTTSTKPVKRMITSFSRDKLQPCSRELVMMEKGEYTAQYRALMEAFLVSLR